MNLKKRGFTLIELMIVLSLFAILATLSITQLSFLDSTIVHTQLDELAALCYYLQQKAICSNQELVLAFDIQKNEYHGGNHHAKLSKPVVFGYSQHAQGPPGQPTGPINKAITFPSAQIRFYPTGIISSGTVYFTDTKKNHTYALSNAVSQLSYLRMYRYDGSWKLL